METEEQHNILLPTCKVWFTLPHCKHSGLAIMALCSRTAGVYYRAHSIVASKFAQCGWKDRRGVLLVTFCVLFARRHGRSRRSLKTELQ